MNTATLSRYTIGFLFSLLLTLAAYGAVVYPAYVHLASGAAVLVAILALAIVQLMVQLSCFLDLGFARGERWKMTVFLITVGLVLIIVIGSLWIMDHLNYNMTPTEMQQYINNQQGF